MRRFIFGLAASSLMATAAVAQTPPGGERFPAAPPLPPGEIVSTPTNGGRPSAYAVSLQPKSTFNYTVPTAMPTAGPTAYTNVVTVQADPPAPTGAVAGCGTCPQSSSLRTFLHHRSTAKQDGCHPTPPRPPLIAYISQERRWGSIGTTVGGCGTSCGSCGTAPTGPGASAEQGIISVSPIPGGSVVGTMQPPQTITVAPLSVPSRRVEGDPIASFRQGIEGVPFTPGGSPMAAPVKAVKQR